MRNKKFRFALIGVGVLLIFLSVMIINDHRERNLGDLVKYKQGDFLMLGFTQGGIPEGKAFSWNNKDEEPADELIEFLSKYHVKRISKDEYPVYFGSDIDMFHFTITHRNANPVIMDVLEDKVHFYVGDYYEVLNGPIDMEWVAKYNEKYLNQYKE
ncbi:hypothetical protein [Bacillus sp. B-jedd]|uniref:hypothetical protein n=1 Tax=Bacillus sp. B-jedd TaxID=1476857 RepID=UPI0005156E37|nr:hypothetical protein [Bacillus sp. B-jedd]CEG25746.1 hypothetical protein BN1002_00563 [Bacillus sp. B-jedd]